MFAICCGLGGTGVELVVVGGQSKWGAGGLGR